MKNNKSKEKYIIEKKQFIHEYSENFNFENNIADYENIDLENLNSRMKREIKKIAEYLEEKEEKRKSEWLKNWINKKPLLAIDNILKEAYSNGEISFIENLIKRINNLIKYFNVINESESGNKYNISLNFIIQIPSILIEYTEEYINSEMTNKEMIKKVEMFLENIDKSNKYYKIKNNMNKDNYENNTSKFIIAA
ncbi:hypothetical protein [Fusobacterium sp.]|uniref:hypothetical protein n=1 Tax=Fusobacterium sp. TaxID=68766 RepID=UPI0026039F35|nr:hypothetical protein [Fusobacterium sp.]